MRLFKSLVSTAALAGLSVAPAAAQAGTLVLYTSQPNDQMVEVLALFNETHPDITVEVYRDGTTKVLNKLRAEIAAGDPKPDVLMIADSVTMNAFKTEGLLMAYPEAPVDGFDPAQYDRDMTWFGTKLITTGIIWNTAAAVPAPSSWTDLLAEAAKGQVIMPSPLYSGAAVIHVGTVTAQDDLGWDYYEKLADNGAVAGTGNGSVLKAVAGGEKAYGIVIDYMAFNAKRDGSPVDFVFPVEGVSAINQPVAILSTADNPEAAKVFVDFQLSRAAQEQAVRQSYIPLMEGVAPPADYPDLSDMTVMTADPDDLHGRIETLKRTFAELFGGA